MKIKKSLQEKEGLQSVHAVDNFQNSTL